MLVIVSSSPQMWGSLFISTNIPDLHSIGPRTVKLFQTGVRPSCRPIFRHGRALFAVMLSEHSLILCRCHSAPDRWDI